MSTYLSNNNIYATDVLGREGLAKFQSQMSHYYQENTEYRAFVEPVSHPLWYEIIARYIPAGGLVLEVGAGRSCFGDYLRQKELQVQYHSQDITKINYQWLSERSCRVCNCPLDEVEGSFDVIFSTYVYEHLVDPKGFLEQADRLLKPGGVHIIVGLNYDVPGYICPSLRHLGKLACLRIGLALFAMRMKQRILVVIIFLSIHRQQYLQLIGIEMLMRAILFHGSIC